MTSLTIRRLSTVDDPQMRLPFPILHPLARDMVAERLGRTTTQLDLFRTGCGFVAIPADGELVWGPERYQGPEPPDGYPSNAPTHENSRGLLAAVERVAPDLLADASPVWPFLTTLPILDEALRTRWHGLNYLYACVSRDVRHVNRRLPHYYVPAGELGNLEHRIDHLFINGRRGVSETKALEGEQPTLSRIEAKYDVPCTSLMDVLTTFAPALDVAAALISFDEVNAELDDAEAADVVIPVLRAVGLQATPA